ncbi:endolysin [Dinoroseobacter phage vB_DshS-R5C]|uniref:Acetylmuramidase n=1 Tax=Dinoroseobacter phage vB_DshS-R5C TaxID=1965368 RepID=A0A1V0DY74_9CAUD|nr:endolysin [Dinoroseobacter phage vB_DshS-R5C]ARB06099.1 acetylmuramidase [Dinoroseobacter phage vB_DshS-R5C]
MTASNFNQTTEWLLVHEGGFVNNPRDPGGATNRGVTQAVYDGYRRRKGLPKQTVRNITTQEVYDIYRTQYWDKVWADDLPQGLDYAVYDFAVNSGPSRAVKFLQRIIGVADDGVMGNVTMGAIAALPRDQVDDVIIQLCTDRWNWMKRLRTWDAFGRGWTRRVMGEEIGVQDRDTGVIDRAVKLHNGAPVTAPTRAAGGQAREQDERSTARARDGLNLDTIGTIAGGVAPTAVVAAIQQEGPMQYALAGVVVLAALMAAVVFYKKVIR